MSSVENISSNRHELPYVAYIRALTQEENTRLTRILHETLSIQATSEAHNLVFRIDFCVQELMDYLEKQFGLNPFDEANYFQLYGGTASHVMASHAYNDRDIRLAHTDLTLDKIQHTVCEYFQSKLNEKMSAIGLKVHPSHDHSNICIKIGWVVDLVFKNALFSSDAPLSLSKFNGWVIFLGTRRVCCIDQTTPCSTKRSFDNALWELQNQICLINNYEKIQELGFRVAHLMIKGVKVGPLSLFAFIPEDMKEKYGTDFGEGCSRLMHLMHKFQENHCPENSSGVVTHVRLIYLLNFLDLIRSNKEQCAEVMRSFLPSQHENGTNFIFANSMVEFITTHPDATADLLNVIYGLLLLQRDCPLDTSSFNFILNRRIYCLQFNREISLGGLAGEIWTSFCKIEQRVASDSHANFFLTCLFNLLDLNLTKNLKREKNELIKKFIFHFNSSPDSHADLHLLHSTLCDNPIFMNLSMVKPIILQFELEKKLTHKLDKNLHRCLLVLLELVKTPFIADWIKNCQKFTICFNNRMPDESTVSLILRCLSYLVRYRKYAKFLLDVTHFCKTQFILTYGLEQEKIELIVELIIKSSILHLESLNVKIVKLLRTLQKSDPLLFDRLMTKKDVAEPLNVLVLNLLKEGYNQEEFILCLIKNSANSSLEFVNLFKKMLDRLSYPSLENGEKILEVVDAIQRKTVFTDRIKSLLIAYSLPRLFSNPTHCIPLLELSIDGVAIDDHLKIVTDFAKYVQQWIKEQSYTEDILLLMFKDAIKVIDPQRKLFILDPSENVYTAISDCLYKALYKINPSLLFQEPYSSFKLSEKSIALIHANKARNRCIIAFKYIITIIEKGQLSKINRGILQLNKVIKKLPSKDRENIKYQSVRSIMYELMMKSNLVGASLIKKISYSLLQTRLINDGQKELLDRYRSRIYLNFAAAGVPNAFSAFKKMFRNKITSRPNWAQKSRGYWISQWEIVKKGFIAQAHSSYIQETYSSLAIQYQKNAHTPVFERMRSSFDENFSHFVMANPRIYSASTFEGLLNSYMSDIDRTPANKAQIKDVIKYACFYLSYKMNKPLYISLLRLIDFWSTNPANFAFIEEILCLIPIPNEVIFNGVADKEMVNALFFLFKHKLTGHVRSNDCEGWVRLYSVVKQTFTEEKLIHLWLKSVSQFLGFFYATLEKQIIEEIAVNAISALNHFETLLPIYEPFLSDKMQSINKIINTLCTLKVDNDLFIKACWLIDLIKEDNKKLHCDLTLSILNWYTSYEGLIRSSDVIFIIERRLKDLRPLIDLNELPESIEKESPQGSFLKIYANFTGIYVEHSFFKNTSRELCTYLENQYFPFLDSLMASSVHTNVKTFFLGTLHMFTLQLVISPTLLEKIFPICLRKKTHEYASCGRMHKLINDHPEIMRVLRTEISKSFPWYDFIASGLGDLLVQDTVKFIRQLTLKECQDLIDLSDLKKEKKIPDKATSAKDPDNKLSMRHVGFKIAETFFKKYQSVVIWELATNEMQLRMKNLEVIMDICYSYFAKDEESSRAIESKSSESISDSIIGPKDQHRIGVQLPKEVIRKVKEPVRAKASSRRRR